VETPLSEVERKKHGGEGAVGNSRSTPGAFILIPFSLFIIPFPPLVVDV
jgi:hypothetical protein